MLHCPFAPYFPCSVLCVYFQPMFPTLHCYAYAPPGATMSVPLARAVSSFITSVAVGKDMVPRMTIPSMHRLMQQSVRCVHVVTWEWFHLLTLTHTGITVSRCLAQTLRRLLL